MTRPQPQRQPSSASDQQQSALVRPPDLSKSPPTPPGSAAGPRPPEGGSATAGRPGSFPSTFSWLGVGIGRNWRGVLAALVSTYFYVPFAIFMAVVTAVVTAIFVTTGATFFALVSVLLRPMIAVPIVGSWADGLLLGLSGPLGGLLGFVVGLVLGFVGALLLPWTILYAHDPVAGFGWIVGSALVGLGVGLVYTLGRVACEGWILRAAGARRMSRRERTLIMPIVRSCAQRMKIGHPPVLIDDSREMSAYAHTRHIVVCQGLLEEFQYDPEVVAGVLSHELVHWRNGDPIAAAFLRGVALPLYGLHAASGWLMRRVNHPLFTVLLWLFLWPVMVTVKYVIMPLQSADTRRAEYRADQGAVLAGHRDGLRRVLVRMRRSFESGRNGWDTSVCATHPPTELRLERLEDPTRAYLLPDPERPAGQPLPAASGTSLRQD